MGLGDLEVSNNSSSNSSSSSSSSSKQVRAVSLVAGEQQEDLDPQQRLVSNCLHNMLSLIKPMQAAIEKWKCISQRTAKFADLRARFGFCLENFDFHASGLFRYATIGSRGSN